MVKSHFTGFSATQSKTKYVYIQLEKTTTTTTTTLLKLTHFTQVGRLASAAANRDAPSAKAALLEGSDFSRNNWITAAAEATTAVVLVQYLVLLCLGLLWPIPLTV